MRYRRQINLMKQPHKEITQDMSMNSMNDTPEALARDKMLLEAFLRADIEAVKSLLQPEDSVRGANPNVRDEFGRTLYHLAHRWGWKEMKGLLHRYGGHIIRHKININNRGIRQNQLER